MQSISNAMRLFFFVIGSILWIGIWLTGFDAAHWLLYVVPVFFYFAAATGICPGMHFSRRLIPEQKKPPTRKRKKG